MLSYCNSNNYDRVKHYIDIGEDINKSDVVGWTSLHIASHEGYIDIIKLLLENNCNMNLKTVGNKTALYISLYRGQDMITNILINKGANCYLSDDQLPYIPRNKLVLLNRIYNFRSTLYKLTGIYPYKNNLIYNTTIIKLLYIRLFL
jgi:ankyrin repeat protein